MELEINNKLMIEKYYFIVYECTRISKGSTTINKCQQLTNIHPIQFQLDCNQKYGHWHSDPHNTHMYKEEYLVLNWIEISKEEYDRFVGYVVI